LGQRFTADLHAQTSLVAVGEGACHSESSRDAADARGFLPQPFCLSPHFRFE